MPELSFKVEGAAAVAYAAVPTLAFKLRIVNAVQSESIHTVALRCQIQIEATRRRYTSKEQQGLLDLPISLCRDSKTTRWPTFSFLAHSTST